MLALAFTTMTAVCPMPIREDDTPITLDKIDKWEWRIQYDLADPVVIQWTNDVQFFIEPGKILCIECRAVMKAGPQGPLGNMFCGVNIKM
jgi:hypothetical protein